MALVAAGTFTAAVNFGLTRYRAGADVALVIAGGVAAVALYDLVRARARTRWVPSGARPTEPTELAGAV